MPPVANRNIRAESGNNANNRKLYSHRERFTAAQVNAGATVILPNRYYKLRVINIILIAIGGAASGATAVVVNGVQSGVTTALLTTAIAGLTANAPNYPGLANNTLAANGGTFAPNDVATAITIGKTGGTLAGATSVDIVISYSLEKL